MSRQNGKSAQKPPERDTEPVADPSDWNQRKRLQQLHEARDHAKRTLVNTAHPDAKKEDKDDVQNVIFAGVKNFVAEVEPLLLDVEAGQKYLYDTELHNIEIEPPEEATEFFHENHRKIINQPEPPQSRTVTVSGLSDFIELDPPYLESWSIEHRDRGSHITTERFEAEVTVPRKTSEEAYRTVNLFLREMNLDLNTEEPRPHGKT